jgi:uncharacterized protein
MNGFEFSEEDFETLSDWLMRRRTGIFDIVELEGFLTAIVIGPKTLSPLEWLPKVWGGKAPKFKDLEEMNRFMALVMRYYNSLGCTFESAPDRFEPTFYERKVDRKTVVIVDEWCVGFMRGVRMDSSSWRPLMRERPELLKPIELFGTRAGWREMKAGGEATMHATWSPRIAPAVREIYAFWLPHRRRVVAAAGVRTH